MSDSHCYAGTYYVDKATSTSADQLLATGLGVVLHHILAQSRGAQRVTICDAGPHFTVTPSRAITEPSLERIEQFSLVKPLVTTKKLEKALQRGQELQGFDYEAARAYREDYQARLKALGNSPLRSPEARLYHKPELSELVGPPPDDDLPLYSAISGFKVAGSVNELTMAWESLPKPALRDALCVLLRAFHTTPNDLTGAKAEWAQVQKRHQLDTKAEVTLLQLLNPVAGKGANRPKANAVTIGQLTGFWLFELLKLVGYFRLAAPLMVTGLKDRKTYVLRPHRIELSTITEVMEDFRAVFWSSTTIKMDVLAALRFTQVFLHRRGQALRQQQDDDLFADPDITAMVEGFDVTFSKDLGNAVATMNMATINLPGWLPKAVDVKEVTEARGLLQEHLDVIRSIGNRGPGKRVEEGADEYVLLRDYRDFLSSRGDLAPFGHFAMAYGPYVLAQRERGRYAVQFTTRNLEVLMVAQKDPKYSRIVRDKGFQAIAGCIRQATVIAQYRSAQQHDRREVRYEVRYGLGQELARKAAYPHDFLVALGEFLHSYNAETARQEELLAKRLERKITSADRRAYHLRFPCSEQDIRAMVDLVDEFKSDVVCQLLLACGYARDERDPVSADTDSLDSEEAGPEDDSTGDAGEEA